MYWEFYERIYKSAIVQLYSGTRVIFDNIMAVGPDGTQRSLELLFYTGKLILAKKVILLAVGLYGE